MNAWLERPLAAFDTETTGVDVETDRIVTACVGFAPKPGVWEPWQVMINPGVEIPAGATAVHGITTEQAAAEGVDPAAGTQKIVDQLYTAWSAGAPVIGHNVIFDLTILDRESRRHLGQPLEVAGPVIDTLVCDKAVDTYRKGSRKLVDVCRHYNVPLGDNAHDATADAFAALRLAYRMMRGWDAQDLRQLYADQAAWYRDQREGFAQYLARQGKTLDNPSTDWPLTPPLDEQAVA